MSRSKRAKLSHGRSIFTEKQQSNDPFVKLPEDVLSLILSKLPLDEAVQTSILSTKWRHKWTSYPKLKFDGITMCGNSTSSKRQYTRKFVKNVNVTLQQCRAAPVEEFEIKFPLHRLLVDHLNNWVSFAVSSRTKYLTIDLEPEDFKLCDYRHMFPFELFDERSMSCLEAIRLSFILLEPPLHFSGFPNLKVLDLRLVDVSSNDLDLVLSGCFNLERLSIVLCHLHDDLRVTSPLPRLQYLLVGFSYINKIQFNAKNLTTLLYRGGMIPFDLNKTLPLRHAKMYFPVLTLEEAIIELPRAIPHVENLNMDACIPLKVLHILENVNKFSHLKNLNLWLSGYGGTREENLLSLASFLRAAPLLEVFDIHFLVGCLPLCDYQNLQVKSLPPCCHC